MAARAEGAHGHTHVSTFAASTGEGVRALKWGTAGLAATTALQLVLLLFSGSVALLGDTLHNGIDVLGTAVVWAAFRLSRRARSDQFSYGYHRFEDFAGLFVVVLILAGAGIVLFESATAFGHDREVARPWLALAAGAIGFLGNEGVAQLKIRTGRRISSAALVADGLHSRADGLTSLGVVAAGIGLLLGAAWLDAGIGFAIGLVILWTAWGSGREVVLRLLDHSDPVLRAELLGVAVTVPLVAHVNELRLRQLGRTVHVVAQVCVPSDTPLGLAHDAAEALQAAWLEELPPGSVVDIHLDPYYPDGVHAGHPQGI